MSDSDSSSSSSSSSSSEARPQQTQSQASRRHGLVSATKQDLSAIAAAVAATSIPIPTATKQSAPKQQQQQQQSSANTTNEPTTKVTSNQCPFCRGKATQTVRTAEETAQLLSRPSLRQQMLDAMVSSQRTTHERFNSTSTSNSNSNPNFNNRSEDADYQKYATAQLHRFLDSDFLPRVTHNAWSLSADPSLRKQKDNEEKQDASVFQVTRTWAIKADQFTTPIHPSSTSSFSNKDDQQQKEATITTTTTKQFHRKRDDFDKQHNDRRTPNALRIRAEKAKEKKEKEEKKKDESESESDSDSDSDREERKRVFAAIAVDGASIQKQAKVGAK